MRWFNSFTDQDWRDFHPALLMLPMSIAVVVVALSRSL